MPKPKPTKKPVCVDNLPSGCESPGCSCRTGPMFLHSRCHPRSPTWVKLDGDVATVECAVCRKTVVVLRLVRRTEVN